MYAEGLGCPCLFYYDSPDPGSSYKSWSRISWNPLLRAFEALGIQKMCFKRKVENTNSVDGR